MAGRAWLEFADAYFQTRGPRVNATDWDFLFALSKLLPAEAIWLLGALRQDPHDCLQRSVVCDWFMDHGYEDAARMIRKGYTPGGLRGADLDAPEFTHTYIGSGAVTSGSIPIERIASGVVVWGHVTIHPSQILSSGMIYFPPLGSGPAGLRPGRSAYEEAQE